MSCNDPSKLISAISYSFNKGIAISCGINAAIVFNHILYWLNHNADNPIANKDGKIWMFEKQKKMSAKFGFLSEKEIKNAIKILCEKGLIIKGNYNESNWDHTNWYTVFDQSLIISDDNKKVLTEVPQGTNGEYPPGPSGILQGTYINKEERHYNKSKKEDIQSCQTTRAASQARGKSEEISFNFDQNKFENISQNDILQWKELYPGVDVDREIKLMAEWCLCNLKKAKSKKKWRKFITGWLERGNEKNINTQAKTSFVKYPPKKEEWPRLNHEEARKLFADNDLYRKGFKLNTFDATNHNGSKELNFRECQPDQLKNRLERMVGFELL